MRRAAAVIAVLATLALAPAAPAQNDPFGPLPQPAPTVTPPPAEPGGGDVEFTRNQLVLLALAVVAAFAAVIWFITRDARRSLSDHDREQIDRAERGLPTERRTPPRKAKKKARQKARAQRAARRRNR